MVYQGLAGADRRRGSGETSGEGPGEYESGIGAACVRAATMDGYAQQSAIALGRNCRAERARFAGRRAQLKGKVYRAVGSGFHLYVNGNRATGSYPEQKETTP